VDASGSRVAVFSLGGTIAMTRQGDDAGVTLGLGAAELVAAVPGLEASGVELEVEDFRRLPSASLGFDDVLALVEACSQRVASGCVGVVVTQGTDTIEETAYLIDLVWSADAPVVVTGAMRNPTLAGADGPANILAAIRVAGSRQMRGLGCLVVMNDEVHAARWVRKRHTTSTATFGSPNVGPIGALVEGTPYLRVRPSRRAPPPSLAAPGDMALVRTVVVPVVLGDDGELVRQVARGAFDGLVVAAFGVGHVPERLVDDLTELAARIPVVLASRVGAGPVLTDTYGYRGSETDLLARSLIPAYDLDCYKARILLHVLLAGGESRDRMVSAFQTHGRLIATGVGSG
jgi:L-asparaginase